MDTRAKQLPRHGRIVSGVKVSADGETVTVLFNGKDDSYVFHAAWLHDAETESAASKNMAAAFQAKTCTPTAVTATVLGNGIKTKVVIEWSDGTTVGFPALWLLVYAPLVARRDGDDTSSDTNGDSDHNSHPRGWLAVDLQIPEFSYRDIFPTQTDNSDFAATKWRIYEAILSHSQLGIVKIVDLPAADLAGERSTENTLVTKILKQLFRSVFHHPIRGGDKTFNVSTLGSDSAARSAHLPNYNTRLVLLPHADHAHYLQPARVQGLYALEGESINTFVSCYAALRTLEQEQPHLVRHLSQAPMAVGRVAHYYTPTMYQGAVDPAITLRPGSAAAGREGGGGGVIKRFRWHPHLAGFLVTPFDQFSEARDAYRALQEIMLRPTHLARIKFAPGHLYLWDNHRILHGRETVLSVPRTAVGQTVPEQVVEDRWREMLTLKATEAVDESWLVHMPFDCLEKLCRTISLANLGEPSGPPGESR